MVEPERLAGCHFIPPSLRCVMVQATICWTGAWALGETVGLTAAPTKKAETTRAAAADATCWRIEVRMVMAVSS